MRASAVRRCPAEHKLLYIFEDYVLDTGRRELRHGNAIVRVQPQVFDLLEFLIRNRDRVVSKDDILGAVWAGRIVSKSALTTRINAARAALEDNGEDQRLIRTIQRKGFRFVGEVKEEQRPADGAAAAVEGPCPNYPRLSQSDRRQQSVASSRSFHASYCSDRAQPAWTPRICATLCEPITDVCRKRPHALMG